MHVPPDPPAPNSPPTPSARGVYIAVAGNMGAGKSTLVDFLCRTYGVTPFFEPGVEQGVENPYLADFYADMERWAFHSQVFFLTHKLKVHQRLDKTPGIIVQDRTIYEDAEVFAAALHKSGRILDRDWRTYLDLYDAVCEAIRPPDLLIYLRCSARTTKKRIALRGRSMEQAIPAAYLRLLQETYDAWFSRWSRSETLVLETDALDYVSDLIDRLDVLERIERFLPSHGVDAVRAARQGAPLIARERA